MSESNFSQCISYPYISLYILLSNVLTNSLAIYVQFLTVLATLAILVLGGGLLCSVLPMCLWL